MDERKQIGERLRWVLLDRYGTLYNASRKLDNQLRTMQRWFTGESMPTEEYLAQFNDEGISVVWILTGRGCAYMESCEVEACCRNSHACTRRGGRPLEFGDRHTSEPLTEGKQVQTAE